MSNNLADCKKQLQRYRHNRFYCPVCGGHNLTFSPVGKWNCWNDDSRAHRLEIMSAVIPTRGKNYSPNPTSEPPPEILLPPIPLISSAQLHLPLMSPVILSETIGNRTIYQYSDCQRVTRFNYHTHKVIRPQYFDGESWVKGAGNKQWIPFGLCRLTAYPGRLNIVLIVEGQKCVEIAYSRGLPAICLEAGDYSNLTLKHKLEVVKSQLNCPLLVILPDNDLSGLYRVRNILSVANRLNLPAFAIDPLKIEPQLKIGGDIEQIPSLTIQYLMHIIKERNKYGLIRIDRRPVAATHPSSDGRNRSAGWSDCLCC